MNKFCLLSKNQNSYFIDRLSEEVGFSNVLVINPFISNELPLSEFYLARTTGVYHSDQDLKLLETVPAHKVINPLPTLTIFRNKVSQYKWFETKSYLALPYLDLSHASPVEVEDFFCAHSEVIIKPIFGQGGWGVRVVDKGDVLSTLSSSDKSYLIQPFMKDAREVRYFFIKNRPPLIQERTPTQGVAANFQNAGKSEVIDLDIHLSLKIEELIEASGALYGAVDCFIKENRVYFLELNTVPGIEQAEKASGRNLIKEILPLFSKKTPKP